MTAQYPREVFAAARCSDECQRCNYDTHTCPGCGEPLPHGIEVCGQVRKGWNAAPSSVQGDTTPEGA